MNNRKKTIDKRKFVIMISAVIVVLVAATILLTGAFGNPIEKFVDYELIEDTNVKSIDLEMYTYYQGYIEITLMSLDIGDEYSVLVYDMSEITDASMIKGVQLLQNGEPLQYITGRITSKKGCALAFESTNGFDNIEIRIEKVDEISYSEVSYPLSFESNVVSFDVEVKGQTGNAEIALDEQTCQIVVSGIEEVRQEQDYDLPISSVQHMLERDGIRDKGPFNIDNPPKTLILVYEDIVYSDDILVVPVS